MPGRMQSWFADASTDLYMASLKLPNQILILVNPLLNSEIKVQY